MKYLKKYNEELVTKFPQYSRGEVVVFSSDRDLDQSTANYLVSKLGFKCTGQIYGNGFIIEVPKGEEEKSGKIIKDKYPDFFGGYERIDVNMDNIYNQCDDIISEVENLRDSLGSLNEFGSSLLPKDWNQSVDNIIEDLKKLKHE